MHCIWDHSHSQFSSALPQTLWAASALNRRRQINECTNQHNILLTGNLFAVLSDEPFLFFLSPKASGQVAQSLSVIFLTAIKQGKLIQAPGTQHASPVVSEASRTYVSDPFIQTMHTKPHSS